MATVGVLGIGRMGGAMARALHAGGHDLTLWNRTPEAATALATELGATTVRHPADVAERVEVTVSMLADSDAVQAVYDGPDGLLAGAHSSVVLVDCSTVQPSTIRAFQSAAAAAGVGLLDAPVSGSVALATTGSLTIMAGGTDADLARARPVLESLATRIFHLGPLGTGAAMKLAVNAVIFGLNGALAEGLVLAERAGIDRTLAYDVLAASAVAAPFVAYKRAAYLEPEETPVAFSLGLAAKDLRLIRALADQVGMTMPQAATNLALIESTGAGAGGPDQDFSAIAASLRAAIGVEEGRSD